MSFLRVHNLLGSTPSHDGYRSLSDGSENKKKAEDKKAAVPLTAHAEQQAKILEHFENKLREGENALNSLKEEMNAIQSQKGVMEHIRVNALFFRNNAASLAISQDEMKQHPDLLQGYVNFHHYLQNTQEYKGKIEACLKTKPAVKNSRIQALYNKLNKQYQDFKKAHDLDEKLTTYMRYDKTVAVIVDHCKQKSEAAVTAAAYRPGM